MPALIFSRYARQKGLSGLSPHGEGAIACPWQGRRAFPFSPHLLPLGQTTGWVNAAQNGWRGPRIIPTRGQRGLPFAPY